MEMTGARSRFPLSLDVYNGYPASLIFALTLHFLVLALLLYSGIARPPQNPEIVQPSIRAFTLDENPQVRNERLQQQRVAAQRERDRQAEQNRQREAEEAARRERERQQQQQEQARQAEQQRQQEADQAAQRERDRQAELQRQADLERQRQQDQERQRQQEQERQAREREEQRQRELAAEQAQRRQAEEAAAAAAEVARTEQEMVMAYTGIIHDLVRQNWSRPPSARNGMTVVFRIQMVPTGDILDVELVQSSGDYAFDRAAETAIYRVGRFQELQGMPINLFNQNFRSLLLTFRPEDLLN